MPKTKKDKKPNKAKFKLNNLNTDKNRRISGSFLVLLALFTFIAFISYLFTWTDDQSIVDGRSVFELMFSGDQVENWLGKLGAYIGHSLIFNSLGISALIISLILFVWGVKVGLGVSIMKMNKLIRNALALFIILPFVFGFVFQNTLPIAGGKMGQSLTQFFVSFIGQVGTGFFILFIAFSYVVIAFNPDLKRLLALFNTSLPSKKATTEEEPETTAPKAPSGLSYLESIKAAEITEDIEEEDKTEEPQTIDLTETEPKDTTTKTAPPKEEKPTSTTLDDLEVTIAKDEEEVSPESEIEMKVEANETDEMSDKEISKLPNDIEDYDPTLDLSNYVLPTIDLLEDHGSGNNEGGGINEAELLENKNKITDTLSNYKIGIEKIKATVGPTVTLYEIIPEAGVRISKIKNLEDDIALSLAALGIRIIAPIPGKGTIGIEVPNSDPAIVSMKGALRSEKFVNAKMELPVALGRTISNETFVTDLAKMPHLLMAGATGQGKSVGLNAILVSLLYKKHPSQLKFVLVDPKKVELTLFNKIERHFLAKLPDEEEAIITDTQKVVKTLNSLCIEMDNRYELLKNAQVRNIKEYNAKFIKRKLNPNDGHQYLPYIVLVVDEFADLIMTAGKEVEMPIARLAQLARAIGIHLIIATQRPSVNIITGIIKANFPARIAFRVTSKIDSRTILDSGGADQLIGRGDMLFSTGNDLTRLQCGFVDTPEVEEICEFIGNQTAYLHALHLPEVEDETSDAGDFDDSDKDVMFEDAAKIIVINQQGSASLLQRKLKLGYNRAGRIIDQLEAAGIVGPSKGSKAREVLIPDEYSLEQFLSNMN